VIGQFRCVTFVSLTRCSGITNTSVLKLARLEMLQKLDLSVTNVTDVSGLGSCSSLHTLGLYRTQVTDVSGLWSCSNLHTLHLEWTQVMDVSDLGVAAAFTRFIS